MTDLARRTTKTTVQAIDKAMANLVVLKRNLSLNLMEIKDANKVAFLDSPVSPMGLFGKRFTAAQKSSQAMLHFLLKQSSSAAGPSPTAPSDG